MSVHSETPCMYKEFMNPKLLKPAKISVLICFIKTVHHRTFSRRTLVTNIINKALLAILKKQIGSFLSGPDYMGHIIKSN